nr:hypothetical protein CFP56_15532 [Quercus suber]
MGTLCSGVFDSYNFEWETESCYTMVERFTGWALPLLNNGNGADGTTELALESLLEFLIFGYVGGIKRYAWPILKACQVLLEDERTSLSLLHRLLGGHWYRTFQSQIDVLLWTVSCSFRNIGWVICSSLRGFCQSSCVT